MTQANQIKMMGQASMPTLAIDPSTKCIGWVFGRVEGPVIHEIQAGRIRINAKTIHDRLEAVFDATFDLVWDQFEESLRFEIVIERPSQHTHAHVYKDAEGRPRAQKTVSGLGIYGVAVGMAWGAVHAAHITLDAACAAGFDVEMKIHSYNPNEWTAKLPSPWRAKKQHGLAAERVWPEYSQFRKRGDGGRDIADAVLLLNHHARESHRIRCREDIERRAAERLATQKRGKGDAE